MGKIVLLDELTINQIAAGEVIERPASVVKEMVENSIDAGAKNITVEIKNGGISLIRITDDGSGISEDDMEIAFERHATSKIRSAKDLQTVTTMGFRGEALASVAAIANVEMISKTENDEIGHRLVIEGGKVLDKSEVAATNGTRITVKNLFYNTPVRYKFLKKNYTEAGYIEDVITRIALVNKDVAIKLINNDKTLLQTNGSSDTKNMIYSIYGKDVANGIKEVDYCYENIKVTGVVGTPDIARSNRSNQLFFVNGRFVRDKNLTAGIEQAYKNIIPTGKYAFCVLNLEINPNEVDVNVHPAKLEVRFEDEQKVFKAVYHSVKEALGSGSTGVSSEIIETKKEDNDLFKNKEKNIDINSLENDNKVVTKLEDNEEEKKHFGGLFKKKKKDNEEFQSMEEEKNNPLLEIFNARKNGRDLSKALSEKEENMTEEVVEKIVEEIPKISVSESAILSEDKKEFFSKEEINNKKDVNNNEKSFVLNTDYKANENNVVANNDIIEKEVKIGTTLVSSNTKELNFDITEKTNDTLNLEKNETKKELSDSITENKVIEKENDETSIETTVPSLDAVEKITSKIMEMKMGALDNTQMIDTSMVREAISDSQKITPEFANMYKKTFGLDANEIRKERELEAKEREKINISNEFVGAENVSLFGNAENDNVNVNYKYVGLAFEKYIIIEFNNEMYIIDQISAIERINLEQIKYNYYLNKTDSTSLLLPDIVSCNFKQMATARENVELFRKAGFDFEEFGENTLKLTAVPTDCEELNTKKLFLNILDAIGDVAVNDIAEKEKKLIKAIAINSIENPNLKLDQKEIDKLIRELLSLEEPFTSEHGRNTAIKMSRGDIEKKFARRK